MAKEMVPFLVRERKAAELCDFSIPRFRDLVNKGVFPSPILHDGEQRWNYEELKQRALLGRAHSFDEYMLRESDHDEPEEWVI